LFEEFTHDSDNKHEERCLYSIVEYLIIQHLTWCILF